MRYIKTISYHTLAATHMQSKEVYGREAHGEAGEGEAAVATTGGISDFTSSQQQQLVGAAPCADGLDWGCDGEGFSHVNSFLNNTSNKLWGKESSQDLFHEDNDTQAGVIPAPVSTAGSARYLALPERILSHPKNLDDEGSV